MAASAVHARILANQPHTVFLLQPSRGAKYCNERACIAYVCP